MVEQVIRRPRVTIGIPIYNNANNVKSLIFALRATVDSLAKNAEMIVYDDGSENSGIATEVESFCKLNDVDFVRGEVNQGVPAAWNQITRRASGNVVLILNDDVRPVQSGWFDEVVSVFDLNSTLGSHTGVRSR